MACEYLPYKSDRHTSMSLKCAFMSIMCNFVSLNLAGIYTLNSYMHVCFNNIKYVGSLHVVKHNITRLFRQKKQPTIFLILYKYDQFIVINSFLRNVHTIFIFGKIAACKA